MGAYPCLMVASARSPQLPKPTKKLETLKPNKQKNNIFWKVDVLGFTSDNLVGASNGVGIYVPFTRSSFGHWVGFVQERRGLKIKRGVENVGTVSPEQKTKYKDSILEWKISF